MSSPTGFDLFAIHGTSASDIWAGGAMGTLLHYDGSSWTQVMAPTMNDIAGVFSPKPGDLWATEGFGSGGIRHLQGGNWTTQKAYGSTCDGGIWGSSASDVWLVCGLGDFLYHWDGGTLGTVNLPPGEGTIGPIHGSSSRDVWMAPRTSLPSFVHWDGKQWTSVLEPALFEPGYDAIFVASPTRAFAFGASQPGGTVGVEWDGTKWSVSSLDDPMKAAQWIGVWGLDDHHVSAVGTGGETASFDGTKWQRTDGGQSAGTALSGVRAGWFVPGGGVWVVGDKGLIAYNTL